MSSPDLYMALIDTARAAVRSLDHHPVAGRLMQGTLPAPVYARYLSQARRQVRGSAPMLAQTAARLRAAGRPELSQLFLRKADEEDGHDAWALSDIEQLGFEPAAVDRECCYAAVDAYVAWTTYCVQLTPVALLGVAWMLEWFGASRAGVAADAMTLRSGIPSIAAAVRFLRGHADADEAHVRALGLAIQGITDGAEARAVLLSAQVTAHLYASFFDAAGMAPTSIPVTPPTARAWGSVVTGTAVHDEPTDRVLSLHRRL